jgi:phosphatidylglycerophosphate synthase
MFDIPLRAGKDRLTAPLAALIPTFISPGLLTLFSFLAGLQACYQALSGEPKWSLTYWAVNRLLDCLDGAVARRRNIASPLGGFLDLLSDFIIYSLIPISVALVQVRSESTWASIAFLEASFHLNNFILFYSAAVAAERNDKELTSVTMRPALIEGFESGVIFTVMLSNPEWLEQLNWGMAAAVGIGIIQRSIAVIGVLSRQDEKLRKVGKKDDSIAGDKGKR